MLQRVTIETDINIVLIFNKFEATKNCLLDILFTTLLSECIVIIKDAKITIAFIPANKRVPLVRFPEERIYLLKSSLSFPEITNIMIVEKMTPSVPKEKITSATIVKIDTAFRTKFVKYFI